MSADTPRTSYLIGRIDRIVRRELGRALGDIDLTVTQYTLMSVLAASPGLSNAQLARRSLVSAQGMNQVVAALDERGLVRRVSHPSNNRIRLVELTAAGRRLLSRCDAAVDRIESEMFGGMDATQRAMFDVTLLELAQLGSDES